MKVFRKELFLRNNRDYIPGRSHETHWWEMCDGVKAYPDSDLPNMYHAKVNGYDFLLHEEWCEEIEDDK